MVEGSALNTTSIRIRWRSPPESHQNGQILGYRVIYAAEGSGSQRVGSSPPHDAPSSTVAAAEHSYTIRGLMAWTTYKIWTLAFTGAGDGPMSDVIVVQTEEGGTL
jgi:Fibronectin type III domain